MKPVKRSLNVCMKYEVQAELTNHDQIFLDLNVEIEKVKNIQLFAK